MPVNYEINVGKLGLDSALRQMKKIEKTELKQEISRISLLKKDRKKQKKFRSKIKGEKANLFNDKYFFVARPKKRKEESLVYVQESKRALNLPQAIETNIEIFNEKEEKTVVGVGIIARRLSNSSYKFIIVKDFNKDTGFKFPGGTPEKIDSSSRHTAKRETKEEIGFFAKVEDFSFIGEFNVPRGFGFFHVYAVDVPKNVILKPGEEQEAIYEVYPYQIEEFIKNGIFLKNHAKAWDLYKKYIEK